MYKGLEGDIFLDDFFGELIWFLLILVYGNLGWFEELELFGGFLSDDDEIDDEIDNEKDYSFVR